MDTINAFLLYLGWAVALSVIALFAYSFPSILRHVRDSWTYTWRLFDAIKTEENLTWRLRLSALKYWFLLAIGWEDVPEYAVCHATGKTAYWPGKEDYRDDEYEDPEIEIPSYDPDAKNRHPFD